MGPTRKMTSTLSSLVRRGTAFLTPNGSTLHVDQSKDFATAPEGTLFPKIDPTVDGEDCDHDCESCTIRYPAKFSIDEDSKLYGQVKGWATHLLVATGKTDWVRDVEDEKGSVMEAVGKCSIKPDNGRLMLSASNIPTPSDDNGPYEQPAICLLLPAFTFIDNVTPGSVPDLITHIVNSAPTSTSRLNSPSSEAQVSEQPSLPPLPFKTRQCPHDVIILLCSQRTRDARCGQSAPLLRREFERHLRPLGLYRDLQDERPGGVGIYFISHTGGHKFSANVMIYRRAGMGKKEVVQGGTGVMIEDDNKKEHDDGAGQCIWLARVRPEECEGIVKFTVLQGKLVKPERQLRGGFDRERGLCSW